MDNTTSRETASDTVQQDTQTPPTPPEDTSPDLNEENTQTMPQTASPGENSHDGTGPERDHESTPAPTPGTTIVNLRLDHAMAESNKWKADGNASASSSKKQKKAVALAKTENFLK